MHEAVFLLNRGTVHKGLSQSLRVVADLLRWEEAGVFWEVGGLAWQIQKLLQRISFFSSLTIHLHHVERWVEESAFSFRVCCCSLWASDN